jgi:hypothetical protein
MVLSVFNSSAKVSQQTQSPSRATSSGTRSVRVAASTRAFWKSFSTTRARRSRAASAGSSARRKVVFPAPRKPATSRRGVIE